MFRGKTTIEMNAATLMEALQEYLEKRVQEDEVPAFTVTAIQGSDYGGTFKVSVEEKQPKGAVSNVPVTSTPST